MSAATEPTTPTNEPTETAAGGRPSGEILHFGNLPNSGAHLCKEFTKKQDGKGVNWYTCTDCGASYSDKRFFTIKIEHAEEGKKAEEWEHQTAAHVVRYFDWARAVISAETFHCMMVQTYSTRVTITAEV